MNLFIFWSRSSQIPWVKHASTHAHMARLCSSKSPTNKCILPALLTSESEYYSNSSVDVFPNLINQSSLSQKKKLAQTTCYCFFILTTTCSKPPHHRVHHGGVILHLQVIGKAHEFTTTQAASAVQIHWMRPRTRLLINANGLHDCWMYKWICNKFTKSALFVSILYTAWSCCPKWHKNQYLTYLLNLTPHVN